MVDRSGILFWGKQKPLKHYFHKGVVTFQVKGDDLFYEVILIGKDGNYPLFINKVKDKQQLDLILESKNLEQLTHLV